MKKYFLPTMVLLMAVQLGYGQTKHKAKELVLDFSTMEFQTKEEIEGNGNAKKFKSLMFDNGGLYRLKVTNINMNLYNISIDKKDSNMVSTVTFPSFELIGMDAISGVISALVPGTIATAVPSVDILLQKRQDLLVQKSNAQHLQGNLKMALQLEKNRLFEKIQKNKKGDLGLEEFTTDTTDIKKDLFFYGKEKLLLDQQIIDIDQALDQIEAQLNAFYLEQKRTDVRTQIMNQIALSKGDVEEQVKLAQITIKYTDSLLNLMNAQALAYFSSATNKPSQYLVNPNLKFVDVNTKVGTYSDEIKAVKKSLGKLKSDYVKFTLSKPEIIRLYKEDTLIKKEHTELLSAYSKVDTELEAALAKIAPEKITEYQKALIHLENNEKREYISIPFQYSSDFSSLKITISPKKPEFGLQTHVAVYKLPAKRFYAGIGASFYSAGFTNEAYSVLETPTSDSTSNFSIVNENAAKGEIGFATLLHVGGKIYKDYVGLHTTIGPGISLASKPLPRMAFGAGLSIGKGKNMLSIDGLWMKGHVNVKSNVFQEGVEYGSKPEQITVTKLSESFGFAIGYIYKF